MKKNDKILIIAVLVIGILACLLFSFRGSGKEVVISQNGVETFRFDLSEENSVVLQYDEKEFNEIVVNDGKVSVIYATCPDQIGVEQGEISQEGETIVCLPHKLVVEIK